MIKKIKEKLKLIFAIGVIAVLFIFVAFLTYNFAEPKVYDFMVRNVFVNRLPFDNQKQIYGSDDIVLVVVDEKTNEKYRWPWKRDLNCKIFEYFLNCANPKMVVDDSILTTLDGDNPQSDKKYFDTLKKLDNLVVGFMPNIFTWEDEKNGKAYEKYFADKFGLNITDKTTPAEILFNSMLKSPKEYLESVKNTGSVYLPLGSINRNISDWAFDEISRTQELLIIGNNAVYPSLGMSAFLASENNPSIILKDKVIKIGEPANQEIKLLNKTFLYNNLQKIEFQTVSVPTRYYKFYDNGYSHKKYSAVDIMDSYDNLIKGKPPVINPAEFEGKFVLIGANVPAGNGLNDNKSTPVAVNHPGIDIQATALDNIIHNDFMKVIPDWANLIICILGILIVFSAIRLFNLTKSVLCTLLINFGYIFAGMVCFYYGYVINIITPVVMFIMTTVFAYTYKYFLENKTKEKVTNAMSKYMSKNVMQDVVKNIDNLGLGGKKSVVTVLFSDIRGFTSLSEKMPAQQVSELLNEYFTEMEPIITKYNGIINKFIGDAIMAIFGEPIQDENHVQNAVKCGYEMLEKVEKLNRKWAVEKKPEIEIGIGINTGEVFVGNIGSVNRMEYTVIGDTVNLASRLESYNKVYKTKMLISPSVYKEVKTFTDALKIPEVRIRGKANKMDIYEVLRVNSNKD